MIRYALAGLALVLTLATAAPAAPPKAPPSVLPSVMELRILLQDGRTATGTAFLALRDGVAVTAWHQVRNARSVTVRFPNGEEFECSGLVDVDEKRNVALLRVKLFGRPLLEMKAVEPAPGSPVFFASAKEEGFGVAAAAMGTPRVEEGVKLLPFQPSVSPGTSGGPLLTPAGEVVGVVAIRTAEGKEEALALPAAYVLALDPTLPTRAWGAPAADPGGDEALDKRVGESLLAGLELLVAYVYADEVTRGQGFLQGMPPVLYQCRQEVESSLKHLANLRTADPLRQRLLAVTVRALDAGVKATDLAIQSVVVAQQQNGWGPASADLCNRSRALIQTEAAMRPEVLADLKQLLEASAAFRATLPAEALYTMGVLERTSGYSLGVQSFHRDPFVFVLVFPKGFAAQLGFEPGDKLVSLGSRTFKTGDTVEDLRREIQAHLGQTLPAMVERGGKPVGLEVDIPKEIPQAFLTP